MAGAPAAALSGTSRRDAGGRRAKCRGSHSTRPAPHAGAACGETREPQPLHCCPRFSHVLALVRVTQTTDLLRQFFPVPSEISQVSAAGPAAAKTFPRAAERRGQDRAVTLFSPSPRSPSPFPGGSGSHPWRVPPTSRTPRPAAAPARAPLRARSPGPAPAGRWVPPGRRPAALTCAFFIRNGSAAVQPSRPCANSLQRNCSSSIMQQPIVHALGLPTASPALPPPVPPPLRSPRCAPSPRLSVRAH